MKFEEAIKALKDGKAIWRWHWPWGFRLRMEDEYIKCGGTHIYIYYKRKSDKLFSLEDFEAEDWEAEE